MRYKPKYGTGSLDVFTASGGWLGSFPGRGDIVVSLNAWIDKFLKWRDAIVEAARSMQGKGTGETHYASFYLHGRLVGGLFGEFTNMTDVVAHVVEIWTENAYGCWDFRFNIYETLVDGVSIDHKIVNQIRDLAEKNEPLA